MSTVLITGANRGLGLEFARQYAASGWSVIACSRNPGAELEALVAGSANVRWHALDVTDHSAIEALAAELAETPVDVLLNNAGFYGRVSFADGGVAHQAFGATDFANWQRVLQVNLFAPMKMAEAFIQHVKRSDQKKIVTLSSMLGSMALNTLGGMYAYRTSKAAVNMMMHSMGIDLGKQGVTAVAMHPGWVRTDMGGPGAEIEAEESVAGVIRVIAELG
ncbi:MAG: SDR family oxidoreductase, partial [Gammaproteobacteria bacterium]|nr:SDR family oxidoreductase [Gammaproteobacteria bacterium]